MVTSRPRLLFFDAVGNGDLLRKNLFRVAYFPGVRKRIIPSRARKTNDQDAAPGDQYPSRHGPFVYFTPITASPRQNVWSFTKLNAFAREHHALAPIVLTIDQLDDPYRSPLCIDFIRGSVSTTSRPMR